MKSMKLLKIDKKRKKMNLFCTEQAKYVESEQIW